MQQFHNELPFTPSHPLTDGLFTEDALFFDIETTGFSPLNTQLYLIGCASRRGGTLYIDQFFADTPKDEPDILEAFLRFADRFHTLISFNGSGFDLPYLKNRCKSLMLTERLSDFSQLDIYRLISPLKGLLSLENARQKTIERFLQLPREDRCSGGELIEVYHAYTHTQDTEMLKLLLLHNYEDVLGMPQLLPVLSYVRLFEGALLECTDCKQVRQTGFQGTPQHSLLLRFTLKYPLPKPVSVKTDDCYLSAEHNLLAINVNFTEGELKHFYPDYKNYYYLTREDTAIHKSVAAYVEKEYRKPARAATCYTKKTGLFLPQYGTPLITPDFYREYKAKPAYFAYEDALFQDPDFRLQYGTQLLAHFASSIGYSVSHECMK